VISTPTLQPAASAYIPKALIDIKRSVSKHLRVVTLKRSSYATFTQMSLDYATCGQVLKVLWLVQFDLPKHISVKSLNNLCAGAWTCPCIKYSVEIGKTLTTSEILAHIIRGTVLDYVSCATFRSLTHYLSWTKPVVCSGCEGRYKGKQNVFNRFDLWIIPESSNQGLCFLYLPASLVMQHNHNTCRIVTTVQSAVEDRSTSRYIQSLSWQTERHV
jgi:hypothetical protein